MFIRPPLRLAVGGRGQRPNELPDPIAQQVEGVLGRSPAQDVAGIQHDLDLATPEVTRPTGESQAPLEERPNPLVDDQARPKQL